MSPSRAKVWIPVVAALIAAVGYIIVAVINRGGCGPGPPEIREITYQGNIREKTNNLPVKDARISILSHPEIPTQTTGGDGNFSIKIKKTEETPQIRVQVRHDNYKEWNELRILNSNPFVDDIILEPTAQTNRHTNLQISGSVSEVNGAPIAGVEVFVIGGVERTTSTNNGTFILEIQGTRSRVHLQASKRGYHPWDGWTAVPSDNNVIQMSRR